MKSVKVRIEKKILSEENYDKIWTIVDFKNMPKLNVLKAFSTLHKTNVIKRIKRGYYYCAKQTILGETSFDKINFAIAKIKDKSSFYCISGMNAYNQLGFTTQVANNITISCDAIARSYENIKYLNRKKPIDGGAIERIILDAIIDIKKIPDTTVEKSILQIKKLIKENKANLTSLLKSAIFEPPRVKSLIGAIAQEFDVDKKLLLKLKKSINPTSMIYLNTGNSLKFYEEWQIKPER
ncbi:MAG: DUF6088 family protein [Candidatus Gastranaerophilales bacterium]|nr:DUF6088 family protein [Candidatus Gastranaerophilales bacterium]